MTARVVSRAARRSANSTGARSLAQHHSALVAASRSRAANRSYYACLQAAIHALRIAGVSPPGRGTKWNHGFVQGQFNGLLINRRHRYGSDLRTILSENYDLHADADYTDKSITEITALRSLRRAERFVAAMVQREGT